MFKHRSLLTSLMLSSAFAFFVLLPGCKPSEETEKDETASPNAVMTKQLNDARSENNSLKQQVEKAQQDNRTLTARVAELETQLSEKPAVSAPAPAPVENTMPAKHATPSNAQGAYDEGLAMYHQGQYQKALESFQSVAESGGDLSDRGAYWAGECQFAMKDFNGAVESFQKVLGFNPSTKRDDAQMMLGNSYLMLGQKSKAKSAFERLVSKYPASPYVKRAKAKMKGL